MLLGSPLHHTLIINKSVINLSCGKEKMWGGRQSPEECAPVQLPPWVQMTIPQMGIKAGMKGHRKGALYMRNDWTGFMRASANTKRSSATEKMAGERQPPLQSTAYMTLGKSHNLLDKHPWTKCIQACVTQLMIKGKWEVLNRSVVIHSATPQTCPPGSSVHGILQASILEWVAIPFTRGSSQPTDRTQASSIADGFFTIWATREVDDKALCKC